MVHHPFTHPATCAVEHTDLMLLGAPINAHKPLVRPGLLISFWVHGGRHDKTHGSLSSLLRMSLSGDLPSVSLGPVLALAAQLPTRGIPRSLSLACKSGGGTRGAGLSGHCEREEHQGLTQLYLISTLL